MTHPLKWLNEHIKQYRALYVMMFFLFTALSAMGGALAQQWLTQAIDERVELRLGQVEDAVQDLKQEMVCGSIEAELKRLRTEMWDLETQLVEAEGNVDLELRLERRISELNASINDELERRRDNNCSTLG